MATSATIRKSPVRMQTLLIYALLPALLAFLSALLTRYVLGWEPSFERLFVYALFVWFYWSLLSGPLAWLNERFPLAEGLNLSRIAVHASALGVSSLCFMLWEITVWYFAVGYDSFAELLAYINSLGILITMSIGAIVYLLLTALLSVSLYMERWKASERRAKEGPSSSQEYVVANGNGADFPARILVKNRGTARLVDVHDIEWIEAMDYCVALHCADGEHVIRRSLKSFESDLDPRQFLRIHRSAIVNLDAIREMQRETGGDYSVIMRDGTVLKLVRSRMEHLEKALNLRAH